MIRRISILLVMMLLTATAAFAEPLPVEENGLNGILTWPEETPVEEAAYTYTYSYPLLTGDQKICADINENFYYFVDDARYFAVPMNAEMIENNDIPAYTRVNAEVTCNNDDFFCVFVSTESDLGAGVSQMVSSYIFARNGAKEGTVTSLPWVLGILKEAENDTWLEERQAAKANDLVWDLVWDIIREQMTQGEINFDPDLDKEMLKREFYPEDDFYMDDEGNVVFFIQPATIASAADGVLYYRFTMDELLDEL